MHRFGTAIRGELNVRDTGKVECAQARGLNHENDSETGNLLQLSSILVNESK